MGKNPQSISLSTSSLPDSTSAASMPTAGPMVKVRHSMRAGGDDGKAAALTTQALPRTPG